MITQVALRTRDGLVWSLPRPKRHGHVIHLVHVTIGDKVEACKLLADHVQGFVNDKGVFLDRQEAYREAFACGQTTKLADPPDLYSEDLW